MRITDSRYDRDRLRLSLAFRLIGLEARTRTIRQATQLSDDRIRRMYRDYFATQSNNTVRRRRGKSPRQMAFFRRSLELVFVVVPVLIGSGVFYIAAGGWLGFIRGRHGSGAPGGH